MPVPEEFYKLYDPIRKRFTSLHGKFLTLDGARSMRSYYINRVKRGVRLDTKDWINDTIIVKVDRDKNIMESYCNDCGSVTDHETAMHVCEQCKRVLDPKEML